VAIALTQASRGKVTALHLTAAPRLTLPWRQRVGRALAPRNVALAAIREIVELGEHYGVEVSGKIRTAGARENAILREAQLARHDLIVMGVSPRSGEPLFFGDVAAELLQRAECSLLLVSSDPVTAPAAAKVPQAAAAAPTRRDAAG
jgi:nucleotide-binding universal stress UspA family protein